MYILSNFISPLKKVFLLFCFIYTNRTMTFDFTVFVFKMIILKPYFTEKCLETSLNLFKDISF